MNTSQIVSGKESRLFNLSADPKDHSTLGTEQGVTAEWIVRTYAAFEKDIRSFVSAKFWRLSDYYKRWIVRSYGNFTGFYNEVKQEALLYCLEHKDRLWQNITLKHIFWAIRYKFKTLLHRYRDLPEIHDSEIGISIEGSFIETCPDNSNTNDQTHTSDIAKEVNRVRLLPEEKKVITYRYFQEMDYQAICKKMNLVNDVVSRHHRNALDKIRTHLVLSNKLNYASS